MKLKHSINIVYCIKERWNKNKAIIRNYNYFILKF